ncbi:MAG: L-lactate permease, partial [Acidobacteriota bacterium]
RLALAELAIALLMALAYVMNYAGTTATLGLALSATGPLFAFFSAYLGFDLERKKDRTLNAFRNEIVGTGGFQYVLPMFVKADVRLDTQGKFRLQLEREDLALSRRLRFDGYWNTDKEYELGLRYILTNRWQVSANYYNEYGFGAGVTYQY